MNKLTRAYFILFGGIFLLCVTIYGVYKDFYAPRIGPIGTGEYSWTTYGFIFAFSISGLCNIILGTYMIINIKKSN